MFKESWKTLFTILLVAIIAFVIAVSTSRAGSFDPAIQDPEVTLMATPCETIVLRLKADPSLWDIPQWKIAAVACGIKQPSPEPERQSSPPAGDPPNDDPTPPNPPTDDPTPPTEPPTQKVKKNASEHNQKGGNDGKGGKERDGTKNSDKGRKNQ